MSKKKDKTAEAVGEMMAIAAEQFGISEPIEITILRPKEKKMSENLAVEIAQDEEYGEKICPVCEQKQDLDLLPEPQKEKLRRQLQIAGVWEAIWGFVDLVGKTNAPYMTRLCFIGRKTKEPILELPSIQLWAGVGEMTPIGRLEQKNEQINKLEQYLYKEVVPKTIEMREFLFRELKGVEARDDLSHDFVEKLRNYL